VPNNRKTNPIPVKEASIFLFQKTPLYKPENISKLKKKPKRITKEIEYIIKDGNLFL
tara:strand:+ start:423 stop:593 length:171 start_codon:yes stop_codon:yes gene_type:complete